MLQTTLPRLDEPAECGSITTLYVEALNGCDDAVCALIGRLRSIVQSVAGEKLRRLRTPTASTSDFVSEAEASFLKCLRLRQIRREQDRTSLTRFLVHIASCKAINHARRENAGRRGGGTVFAESDLLGDDFLDYQTCPGYVEPKAFDVHCRELLESLPEDLARVAVMRMQGYLNREIADELQCAEGTVERKLQTTRLLWRDYV